MSSLTNEVSVTMYFGDYTTRSYTLPDVQSDALSGVKQRVKDLRNVMAGSTSEIAQTTVEYGQSMLRTFVSADGAPLIDISKCVITSTQEEVIYSG